MANEARTTFDLDGAISPLARAFLRNRVALCLFCALAIGGCRSNGDSVEQGAGSGGSAAGSGGAGGGDGDGDGDAGGDGDGDGDAGGDGDVTRDACAPQRFEGRGNCEPGPIYYWTGFGCYGLVACDCIGPDCDDGFASEEACMAAHAECTSDSVKHCGGLSGGACGAGEYCEMLPRAACGISDAGGTCQPIPTSCDANYEPVCGCDNEEYGNACEAAMAERGLQSFSACGICVPECTGAAPDDGIYDECRAIYEEAECMSHETGGFPAGCRWLTADSEPCLAP